MQKLLNFHHLFVFFSKIFLLRVLWFGECCFAFKSVVLYLSIVVLYVSVNRYTYIRYTQNVFDSVWQNKTQRKNFSNFRDFSKNSTRIIVSYEACIISFHIKLFFKIIGILPKLLENGCYLPEQAFCPRLLPPLLRRICE